MRAMLPPAVRLSTNFERPESATNCWSCLVRAAIFSSLRMRRSVSRTTSTSRTVSTSSQEGSDDGGISKHLADHLAAADWQGPAQGVVNLGVLLVTEGVEKRSG